MMINTFKFSKCLIIFLVYNIMIIFTVTCNDFDTDDTENKIVPDFDIINQADQGDYFKYYLRGSKYAGQLKVRPKTFFKSVYNCDYLILPELDEDNDYDTYKNKMREPNKIFKSIFDKYNANYQNIKEQEDHYVQEFKKSYIATKKAYDEVIKYERLTSYQLLYTKKQPQEDAIKNYLTNQMPEISEETFPNAYWEKQIRYTYKNYEVYADPTDEVYYRSNILQEEYNAVMDGDKIKTCDVILSKEEYDEVRFLYAFLGRNIYYQADFISAKIDIFLQLQNTLPNLSKIYKKDELMKLENDMPEDSPDDFTSTTSKLQNEFVVNHENYMSYLVRMKILGRIGFHLDYHKHMYKTRPDYGPALNVSDSYIDSPNLGKRYIDMDIHETTEQDNYAELKPFNPKDI